MDIETFDALVNGPTMDTAAVTAVQAHARGGRARRRFGAAILMQCVVRGGVVRIAAARAALDRKFADEQKKGFAVTAPDAISTVRRERGELSVDDLEDGPLPTPSADEDDAPLPGVATRSCAALARLVMESAAASDALVYDTLLRRLKHVHGSDALQHLMQPSESARRISASKVVQRAWRISRRNRFWAAVRGAVDERVHAARAFQQKWRGRQGGAAAGTSVQSRLAQANALRAAKAAADGAETDAGADGVDADVDVDAAADDASASSVEVRLTQAKDLAVVKAAAAAGDTAAVAAADHPEPLASVERLEQAHVTTDATAAAAEAIEETPPAAASSVKMRLAQAARLKLSVEATEELSAAAEAAASAFAAVKSEAVGASATSSAPAPKAAAAAAAVLHAEMPMQAAAAEETKRVAAARAIQRKWRWSLMWRRLHVLTRAHRLEVAAAKQMQGGAAARRERKEREDAAVRLQRAWHARAMRIGVRALVRRAARMRGAARTLLQAWETQRSRGRCARAWLANLQRKAAAAAVVTAAAAEASDWKRVASPAKSSHVVRFEAAVTIAAYEPAIAALFAHFTAADLAPEAETSMTFAELEWCCRETGVLPVVLERRTLFGIFKSVAAGRCALRVEDFQSCLASVANVGLSQPPFAALHTTPQSRVDALFKGLLLEDAKELHAFLAQLSNPDLSKSSGDVTSHAAVAARLRTALGVGGLSRKQAAAVGGSGSGGDSKASSKRRSRKSKKSSSGSQRRKQQQQQQQHQQPRVEPRQPSPERAPPQSHAALMDPTFDRVEWLLDELQLSYGCDDPHEYNALLRGEFGVFFDDDVSSALYEIVKGGRSSSSTQSEGGAAAAAESRRRAALEDAAPAPRIMTPLPAVRPANGKRAAASRVASTFTPPTPIRTTSFALLPSADDEARQQPARVREERVVGFLPPVDNGGDRGGGARPQSPRRTPEQRNRSRSQKPQRKLRSPPPPRRQSSSDELGFVAPLPGLPQQQQRQQRERELLIQPQQQPQRRRKKRSRLQQPKEVQWPQQFAA